MLVGINKQKQKYKIINNLISAKYLEKQNVVKQIPQVWKLKKIKIYDNYSLKNPFNYLSNRPIKASVAFM